MSNLNLNLNNNNLDPIDTLDVLNRIVELEPPIVLGIWLLLFGISQGMNLIQHYRRLRVIQEELARAQEGLPTDVTLTAQDFRDTPELAEMFGITNIEEDLNLDFNLETQNQFELAQAQAELDQDNQLNLMERGERQVMNLIESIVDGEITPTHVVEQINSFFNAIYNQIIFLYLDICLTIIDIYHYFLSFFF